MKTLAYSLLLALLVLPAHARAAPRPSVVVAPLVSSAAEEHQWIGPALAEAFTARLLSSGEASVLSQRQWAAALRERNIALREVKGDDDARLVALQVGAEQVVVGSFTATWPDVRIQARRVAVDGSVALASAEVSGHLEDLPKLEAALASALFKTAFPKAASAKATPKSAYAWHALAKCKDALALQSMGPRARPWLPPALVERALAHCQEAEKLDASLVEATSFHALALLLLGKKEEAKALADKALKGAKVAGWPHLVAYFTKLQAGDAAAAEKVLADVVKKSPGFLHARTTLGESLFERGQLALAKAVFEASLADAPRQPWVLVQLSKVQAKQGDVDGALESVEQALSYAPGDAVLLMEKGSRLIDAKRYPEAEKVLREAMTKDPHLAALYLRLGFLYLETQQLELAGTILQKALFEADLESESRVRGYAHFDLAKLAARRGERQKALDHVSKAVAAGFVEEERFASDPDLASLVKDPAFGAILKR